jgi:2'-5' RNA ligase
MDNVFFAILPDEDAKARIATLGARLQRDHGVRGKPIAPDCLHVSVHALEPYDDSIIEAAKGVGALIDAPCFKVGFDRVLSFNGGPSVPLVLAFSDDLPALMAMRRSLGGELKRKLGQRTRPSFTPHLTFLYADHRVPDLDIDLISWTVREFVLVRSVHGDGRHVQLGRWPLRPTS